jgi:hypothetical protein
MYGAEKEAQLGLRNANVGQQQCSDHWWESGRVPTDHDTISLRLHVLIAITALQTTGNYLLHVQCLLFASCCLEFKN